MAAYSFTLSLADPTLTINAVMGDTLTVSDPDEVFRGTWNAYRNGNDLIIDFIGVGQITVVGQFPTAKLAQISFVGPVVQEADTFTFNYSFTGTSVNEFFIGTSGDDIITTGGGGNLVHAGAGNDTIIGSTGGSDDDDEYWEELFGGEGNDSIVGNGGEDEFTPGQGNDTVDALGEHYWSAVNYVSSAVPIIVNFSGQTINGQTNGTVREVTAGTAQAPTSFTTDLLNGVEEVYGTAYDDIYYAGRPVVWDSQNPDVNVEHTTFNGMGGNDHFVASFSSSGAQMGVDYEYAEAAVIVNLGSASFNGVAPNTASDGLGGTDTLDLSAASAGHWLNLNVEGGKYNDTLIGSSNIHLQTNFVGRGGDDTLTGGAGGNDYAAYWDDPEGVDPGIIANLSAGPLTVKGVTVQANQVRDNFYGIDTLVNIRNISGSWGNDYILGSSDANKLSGYEGNDTILGGAGNDTIDGGNGIKDYASYWNATGSVTVNLATGTASGADGIDTLINIERIFGSLYNDTLTGDAYSENYIDGRAGDDIIDGGAGDWDAAAYWNAAGSVTVNLASGTSSGADGNDTLINIERIFGSLYNDTLTADASDKNYIEGRAGDDTIDGGAGSRDFASYWDAPGSVTVNLATGTASGADGNDTLINIERIFGSLYNDTLTGDGYDKNYIEGRAGDDIIDGGAGNFDAASYWNASGSVTVNLATGTSSGADGNDTLINIERIFGSLYDDVLTGNASDNVIEGRAGDDLIDGGAGQDTARFAGLRAEYSVVAVGAGFEITGPDGKDSLTGIEQLAFSTDNFTTYELVPISDYIGKQLIGTAGADTLEGGASDDTLEGGLGNDTLIGGGGSDTVVYANAPSGVTVNLTQGTASGGEGNDTLVAISNVRGSQYTDTLIGDGNANTLDGNAGADRMEGGTGADTYLVDDGGDVVYETDNTPSGSQGLRLGLDLGSTIDTVTASISYALTNYVENLQLATGAGNLTATGNSLDNVLVGNDGNNTLTGDAGNDSLDGGSGTDTAIFSGNLAAYSRTLAGSTWTVLANSGSDGTDTLTNIERLQFTDAKIALDITGNRSACFDTAGLANAGQVYRLYEAMFNRAPDQAGLAYWIGQADVSTPLTTIATTFASGQEYRNKYGNLSDHAFIDQLYLNVLGRAGEAAGTAYWYGQLDTAAMSREQVLVGFSESTENQAAVIGVIQSGIDFTI